MTEGSGPKNRRKQERRQHQLEDTNSAGTPQLVQERHQAKNFRPRTNEQRKGFAGDKPRQQQHHVTRKSSNMDHKKDFGENEKKKKKFQKPKHLKRKLESAVADEALQQKVLQELQSFEALKSQGATTKKKKQKLNTNTNNNNNNNNNNNTSDYDESLPRSFPKQEDQVLVPNKPTELYEEKKKKEKPKDSNKKPAIAPEEPQKGTNNPKFDSNNKNDGTSGPPSHSKSNEYSSDEEGETAGDQATQRTRGRRRRGRKKTSEQVQQQQQQNTTNPAVESSSDAAKSSTEQETVSEQEKRERYCLGRKPVTDYVVGQSYPAKVVYIKPFGVFFDIGCHSDAFCHVSRLSDGFVENPEQLFQQGDSVPAVRIVEIDRKAKRITLSLQSLARLDDEKASLEARLKRRQKSGSTKQRDRASKTQNDPPKDNHKSDEIEPTQVNTKSLVSKETSKTTTVINKTESEMTPGDLKRARKIARRAARRGQPATQEGVDTE